jgi:hypothetical protein
LGATKRLYYQQGRGTSSRTVDNPARLGDMGGVGIFERNLSPLWNRDMKLF